MGSVLLVRRLLLGARLECRVTIWVLGGAARWGGLLFCCAGSLLDCSCAVRLWFARAVELAASLQCAVVAWLGFRYTILV